MSWLEKLLPPKMQQTDPSERRTVPEGLWIKCPSCETVLYKNDLEQNVNVCPKCGHHHRIGARARLNAFLDGEGRYEIGQEVLPVDALKFKDSKRYPERLKQAMEATGETDALVVMGGALHTIPVVVACFVACLFRESSQHPMCPQNVQRRRCSHQLSVASHSTQPGPDGGTSGLMYCSTSSMVFSS
jgi:acetyl-CoA carboxylase beta subunit